MSVLTASQVFCIDKDSLYSNYYGYNVLVLFQVKLTMAEPTVAAKVPVVLDLQPGTYYWCTCGLSANQPFCNGAHKGSEFTPLAFELTESKRVALCQCKHTGNSPFCDGAHAKL